MSIDLSQFHQVFFEESFEGLDAMESALLGLKPEAIDSELINLIFRSAHSIKGGGATFGFTKVAEFTHVLETLLDEVRDGSRSIDQETVDLLLESVDCLRDLIGGAQSKIPEDEIDNTEAEILRKRFEVILGTKEGKKVATDGSEKSTRAPVVTGWDIYFKPGKEILQTGNEPLRMFRELATLGQLEVVVKVGEVPGFRSINPEECFLIWQLVLKSEDSKTSIDEAAVREVFEWVIDESEIKFNAIHAEQPVEQELKLVKEASDTDIDDGVPVKLEDVLGAAKGAGKAQKADASSIRVGIDKIDNLINMVGELVITQSMLSQLGKDFDLNDVAKLQAGLGQLEHNTRELQESVMRIRMIPISFTFSRFPRMVRDMCRRLDKKIELKLIGEQTELDKTVMEKIGDPLVHLVRNALDHGIESPADRLAAGKPETGTITLEAYHQGGNIMIQIKDDGGGLPREKIHKKAIENGLIASSDQLSDEQIQDLIFHPGFSTAEVVSDVSGRGVGMDVVRRNIEELNGSVAVVSEEGVGSTFTISLPLTLAILDGQLVRIGGQIYIFPLISIVESLQINIENVNSVAGGCDVLRLRNEYIPIIKMFEVFDIEPERRELDKSLLVVVEGDGEKVGLVVDELAAQQQVVIKSLEANYQKVEGISGATILGDGTVALILDVTGVIKLAGIQGLSSHVNLESAESQAA